MRWFSKLYHKMMVWAQHRHAPAYLVAVSFAEASFFPIPPETMLLPMSLAQPKRAWWFALICTLASVTGAVLGYVIGALFIHFTLPVIEHFGYLDTYQQVQQYFNHYGIWIILIAGFTPIPYKLFTIAAGSMAMPLVPFVVASLFARGVRYYLLSGLMVLFGERLTPMIPKYVDALGWLTVVATIAYVLVKLYG